MRLKKNSVRVAEVDCVLELIFVVERSICRRCASCSKSYFDAQEWCFIHQKDSPSFGLAVLVAAAARDHDPKTGSAVPALPASSRMRRRTHPYELPWSRRTMVNSHVFLARLIIRPSHSKTESPIACSMVQRESRPRPIFELSVAADDQSGCQAAVPAFVCRDTSPSDRTERAAPNFFCFAFFVSGQTAIEKSAFNSRHDEQ